MYHFSRIQSGFLFLILLIAFSADAKTRWSTFHCIPDADLLDGGGIVIDPCGYFPIGDTGGMKPKPGGILTLGIIEWVNISGGYAGGPTFGLKARILGETKDWMPSLALGIHNIYSHEEVYRYSSKDSLSNEIYLALGKSVENLRLRVNIGVQSIPQNQNDKVNPFAGIEKYFGGGLYTTIEYYRRQKENVLALFVDWRFLKRSVELYAGAVDIIGLFSGNNGDSTGSSKFVKPGILGGIRVNINMKHGKSGAFSTVEDRVALQGKQIAVLNNEIDSLKKLMFLGAVRIDGLTKSVKAMVDSNGSDDSKLKMAALEKLATLKGLYEQEPFEPEPVKIAMKELTIHKDKVLPVLLEIANDKKEDAKIRTLAVSACGEIGTSAAADVLIEILGQTQVPEMKIEALIALGKLKEVRAAFLMQQLAADPDDAVAFTALEVLQKLEKETGIPLLNSVKKTTPIESIPENKIGERRAGNTGLNEVLDETAKPKEQPSQKIQKIEKPEFSESVIQKTPTDVGNKSDSSTKKESKPVKVDTTVKLEKPVVKQEQSVDTIKQKKSIADTVSVPAKKETTETKIDSIPAKVQNVSDTVNTKQSTVTENKQNDQKNSADKTTVKPANDKMNKPAETVKNPKKKVKETGGW